MKTNEENRLSLEHIIPIPKGRHIFIYGMNENNAIIYCYSDKPEIMLTDIIKQDGRWAILGKLRIPIVYFKKYIEKPL
jgi:hypothetical protein